MQQVWSHRSSFLAADYGRELEHDGVGLLAAATIGSFFLAREEQQ